MLVSWVPDFLVEFSVFFLQKLILGSPKTSKTIAYILVNHNDGRVYTIIIQSTLSSGNFSWRAFNRESSPKCRLNRRVSKVSSASWSQTGLIFNNLFFFALQEDCSTYLELSFFSQFFHSDFSSSLGFTFMLSRMGWTESHFLKQHNWYYWNRTFAISDFSVRNLGNLHFFSSADSVVLCNIAASFPAW